MILPIFTAVGLGILSVSILMRKKSEDEDSIHIGELDKFYELSDEPASAQLRQLVRAAREYISLAKELSNKISTAAELRDSKLIGKNYYNKLLAHEQDMRIAKILIENEAEMFKSGYREQIFADANKMPEFTIPPKKKMLDEAILLKRQAILTKNLEKYLNIAIK